MTPIELSIGHELEIEVARFSNDWLFKWHNLNIEGRLVDVESFQGNSRIRLGGIRFGSQQQDIFWHALTTYLQQKIHAVFRGWYEATKDYPSKIRLGSLAGIEKTVGRFVAGIFQRAISTDQALRGRGFPERIAPYEPLQYDVRVREEINRVAESYRRLLEMSPDRLEAMASYYGEEAGVDPYSEPPEIDRLPNSEAAEKIVEWFFANFEDPVHSVSYISREGGYQYVYGPYSARDVVQNVFHTNNQVMEAAIDIIESDGVEWVPSSTRIHGDQFENYTDSSNLQVLHEEMLRRISAVEETILQIKSNPSGIGHNRPPSPIEDSPIDDAELREIEHLIALLKEQPVSPEREPLEATKAAAQLDGYSRRIVGYVAKQADNFATAVVKKAGGLLATGIVLSPIWLAFGEQLRVLAAAALAWAKAGFPGI